MKIVIYPFNQQENKYIDLIKKSITLSNPSIELVDFKHARYIGRFFDEIDYYYFNWFESLYTSNIVKLNIRFLKKVLILSYIKLRKKKIIWVVHNKIPHDSKYTLYSIILMKLLIKYSYKIVIHSWESKEIINELDSSSYVQKKIVYIPHPHYIDAYTNHSVQSAQNEEVSNKIKLLFIGQIKPYKNIDLLIEVFNDLNSKNMELLLVGKVISKKYENYIKRLINNNANIKTDFRFITDNEINDLIIKSDLIVLPYDLQSSLNSGTIFLAFSNKRTVICPYIGTLKDFPDDSLFFAYSYKDRQSHKTKLKEILMKIEYLSKIKELNVLNMGENCYQVIKETNSLEKISEIFSKLLV